MAQELTAKEVAEKFGTDPRTLRKFLRKDAKDRSVETPGKGSRWSLPAKDLKSLRKRFDSWVADRTPVEDATEPEPGEVHEDETE